MRGIPWRLLAAGALTALLLDLPFPLAGPLPVWRTLFAWFALVPLTVALLTLPLTQTERRRRWILGWSFLGGWLTGALWFGSNCYWVYNVMHVYGGMDAPLAVFSLVLFSLFLGFWFGVFALFLAMIRLATIHRGNSWLAVAAIPFLWIAMEFAIARIPSFPWDQLGYSQIDNGLLTRLAPWAGVYGISFLLAGVNALLTGAILLRRVRIKRGPVSFSPSAFCASLGVMLIVIGGLGFLLHPPEAPGESLAMLIQPNLDVASDDVWVGQEWDRRISQFRDLAENSCKDYIAGMPETGAPTASLKCGIAGPYPGLIVWPESPAPFRGLDPKFQTSTASIAKLGPVIVGNIGMDEDPITQQMHIYNSASVVAQDGHVVGRYDKIHLVPFGEYVPFRHLLFFARQITQNLSDMGNGDLRKTFRIQTGDASWQRGQAHRYGIFICYESVFGDEVRQFAQLGAEVFVNISDDGWYGDSSAPWQHLNMARMRAIENRRWILRDTNNGVTASIDPYGVIRQSIPRHQVDALPAQFGYNSEVTFYTAHGDWLPALCAILSLALLVWSGRKILGQVASETPRRAEIRR